jgi:catechol 2,3-dioxygenase-like lactoylglutathione lyase family enzyme
MKIKLTSVYVVDQEKALRFYTEVLGFVKKTDISQGPYRWLMVASPEEPDGDIFFPWGKVSIPSLKGEVARGPKNQIPMPSEVILS